MSEAIAEMVLPGTYIEVRSEGLIGASAVSTGNLGIVGSAASGTPGKVVALSSYAEALDAFGPPDAYSAAAIDHPLSLVRALQLAFIGGARNVWAVRIAAGDPTAAFLALKTTKSDLVLTAASPGTWGNAITAQLQLDTTPPAWTLTLARGTRRERFSGEGIKASGLYDQLSVAGASKLVTAGPKPDAAAELVALNTATPLHDGTDLPAVTGVELAAGLAVLEDQPINIVLVAGFGAGEPSVASAVGGHLENTENAGRERIAIVGAKASGDATDAGGVLSEAGDLRDDRIVLVAPGLVAGDPVTGVPVVLPPPYLAAVVAGALCSLAPHVSLTNRSLPIDRLDVAYSTATVTQLLQSRVTVVRRKLGYQVVKGITTDDGAFRQISVRRIVDYAKTGVRSGADPYIGKLNNARVRAALKATLDGFLSQMVLDEMLVSYELEVSATRAQEIQGIAAVAVTLRPTFSIDFIRVTMTLQ